MEGGRTTGVWRQLAEREAMRDGKRQGEREAKTETM